MNCSPLCRSKKEEVFTISVWYYTIVRANNAHIRKYSVTLIAKKIHNDSGTQCTMLLWGCYLDYLFWNSSLPFTKIHFFFFLFFFLVGTLLLAIDVTQQLANGKKYPSYSLQNMPKTDFSCRDKILGGYYADAETRCQMFHICVKVAGVGVCISLAQL